MSLKNILHELKEMKDAIRCKSTRRVEGKHWGGRSKSYIAPESVEQGQWADLPPDLLLDIIRRIEASETAWSLQRVIIFCASVCRSWRDITREIIKTPDECRRLTFPISLKLPGPPDAPIQCYIKRDKPTSTYRLHFNFEPSDEDEYDKLLLAAKRIRRATSTDFVISLVGDDFSRASSAYVGKLRSNFMGNKFTIYDIQPPNEGAVKHISRKSRRFNAKQVSPRLPAYNYHVATICYELHGLHPKRPRQMHCVMLSIPASSVQEGGNVPTPKSFSQWADKKPPSLQITKGNEPAVYFEEALVLKNRAPRWHDEMQCWCLNFRGRVTVPSVKNFQLVTEDDSFSNVAAAEHEKIILQFGKIAEDIFTMDYRYPLSAFQAFAICLSSFDSKPACE